MGGWCVDALSLSAVMMKLLPISADGTTEMVSGASTYARFPMPSVHWSYCFGPVGRVEGVGCRVQGVGCRV